MAEIAVPRQPLGNTDPVALADDLTAQLSDYQARMDDDPMACPVLMLALEIGRRLDAGALDEAAIETLIQDQTMAAFEARAGRLGRYLGETDPAENRRAIEALMAEFACPEGANTCSFDDFRARVERVMYGIVLTAHPTFDISGELTCILAQLATGRDRDGRILDMAARKALLEQARAAHHRPDDPVTLDIEHALSVRALENIRSGLRHIWLSVLHAAEKLWPDRWRELTPAMVSVATWVGYDLDGRSDIAWTDILHKRLVIQKSQLEWYVAGIARIRASAGKSGLGQELSESLDLIESRLQLAISEVTDEIEIFGQADPGDDDGVTLIARIARRMHEGAGRRLVKPSDLVQRLDRALKLANDNDDVAREILLMRAGAATFGLGLARSHMRINATQIHNAVRKEVDLTTDPEDPRFARGYQNRMADMLAKVSPETINFGTILAERTSARRLFMIVRQMMEYCDSETPVRFLIAETESAFTPMAALYLARLFGIDDRLEICPLFETEAALQRGSRVIEQLIEQPEYRKYIEAQGRICVQTGYSDAGRYIGQCPAAGSIERLKERLERVLVEHDLQHIELVVFDTHGESIGRGGHPGGFAERLRYITAPHLRARMNRSGIRFVQESSYQGGDGFVHFFTEAAAIASLTRIVEYMLSAEQAKPEDDPYYGAARDYVTEFFTIVKAFQVDLMEDANYGALISAQGTNLVYPTGSRAAKRQYEVRPDEVNYQHPSTLRAIPHNATLQQLGLPANTLGGLGAAIGRDPATFIQLYRNSSRFRSLIGMARYGHAIADIEAMRGLIESMNPGIWLRLAARTDDERMAAHMNAVAGALGEGHAHIHMARVFRILFRDFAVLDDAMQRLDSEPGQQDAPGAGLITDEDARAISLLQAVRMALIHRIFILAVQIPEFSGQHAITPAQLVRRIMQLDIPSSLALLARIFPANRPAPEDVHDFGAPASYRSEAAQDYSAENSQIVEPLERLYDLVRRISTALVHRYGFFG